MGAFERHNQNPCPSVVRSLVVFARLVPRPTRRFLIRCAAAGFALAIGAGGVLWFLGSALLAAAPANVRLPAEFRGTYVAFPSASGSLLRGNLRRGRPGMGTVILMHGIRLHRGSLVRHAEFIHAAGFSVLMFDFQAHGESPGERITNGCLESRDATAAVGFARAQFPREPIAVLGISLGGAAALLAEPPLEVDAMILEMVFPDLDRAIKNRLAIRLGRWARALSPLLAWQLKARLGVAADWFSPERGIARVRCPKLIISGARDQHTTLDDTHSLYRAASDPKERWIIDEAAHQDLYALNGQAYESRILQFLSKIQVPER